MPFEEVLLVDRQLDRDGTLAAGDCWEGEEIRMAYSGLRDQVR